jgi:hypothetical protein
MISLRTLWQRITTTRYTRALEAEVTRERAENQRLRAENRALLNSILGIPGVPPLPVVVAPPGLPAVAGVASPESHHDLPVDARSSLPKQNGSVAIPMRRRSWQQINRMLEFESAKKKDANAAP